MRALVVNLLIDSPPDQLYHVATVAALRHVSEHRAVPIEIRVMQTDTIVDPEVLAAPGSAVVIGPGSPYRDPEAVYAVVRAARERGVPLVGT
jgi:CTP synthase (UTP-ammonia lyase)